MSDTKFDRIKPYSAQWKFTYCKYGPNVEYQRGWPQTLDYALDPRLKSIVIDDLMCELLNSVIADLFSKGSHHIKFSVVYITQNIFH